MYKANHSLAFRMTFLYHDYDLLTLLKMAPSSKVNDSLSNSPEAHEARTTLVPQIAMLHVHDEPSTE